MTYLIIGLVIFLGAHSVRIYAEDWRTRAIARMGPNGWKAVYSLVSIAGFVLLVWGFGQARQAGGVLYAPPIFMRHITALLVLISFVLLAAAKVPRNHIKAAVGHPMVAGVKLWAFAHLLANGRVADVILFGAFLVWAIVDFIVARRRDRAAGTRYPAGTVAGTALTVVIGVAAWVVFAFWAHQWLFGVAPFA
jgi:uncharacterized membrane protein